MLNVFSFLSMSAYPTQEDPHGNVEWTCSLKGNMHIYYISLGSKKRDIFFKHL